MTRNAFDLLCQAAAALPPEQMRQLRDELDRKLLASASRASAEVGSDPDADPLLGLWRDYADEMDEIVAEAYRHRREDSWRDFDP